MKKDHFKRGKDHPSSKAVTLILHDNKEIDFETTWQASEWLSEHLEIPYTPVDRYLVSILKDRELNIPKKYQGILPKYTIKYTKTD